MYYALMYNNSLLQQCHIGDALCFVFSPDFHCCTHPKSGCNIFWHFSHICSSSNRVSSFFIWKEEKDAKKLCFSDSLKLVDTEMLLKTLKMTFSTSVWSAQHPIAGRNIQHVAYIEGNWLLSKTSLRSWKINWHGSNERKVRIKWKTIFVNLVQLPVIL